QQLLRIRRDQRLAPVPPARDSMKILVCIKSVPDTETKIKIAADGKSADLTGAKRIISPYDEDAPEAAPLLKQAGGAAGGAELGGGRRAADAPPRARDGRGPGDPRPGREARRRRPAGPRAGAGRGDPGGRGGPGLRREARRRRRRGAGRADARRAARSAAR